MKEVEESASLLAFTLNVKCMGLFAAQEYVTVDGESTGFIMLSSPIGQTPL